jgi:hypothetical protein
MSRTFSLLLSMAVLGTSSIYAQAPTPQTKDDQELLALIKEVQAQQAQIADNQAKIETKLAEVAEAIRVARIYSSRGR